MLSRNSKQHGFTLIELMITVAIVAILAAIAYPSYTKYVQRGYRSEGLALLTDAVARSERYYAQNNSYKVSLKGVGLVTDDKITTVSSANGKYLLSLVSSTDTTYSWQVAPQGSQQNDACGTLTIAQDGSKTSSTNATDCFK